MDEQQRIHEENMDEPEAQVPEQLPEPPMMLVEAAPENIGMTTDDFDEQPPEPAPSFVLPPEPTAVPISRFRIPNIRPPRRALEGLGNFLARPVAPQPPEPEAPRQDSVEEFVELSRDDEDFLYGTDDELIDIGEDSHPEDISAMSAKDRDFLLGSDINKITGMGNRRKVTYRQTGSRRRRTSGGSNDQFLSRTGE